MTRDAKRYHKMKKFGTRWASEMLRGNNWFQEVAKDGKRWLVVV